MSFCFVFLINRILNVYINLFSHFQLVGGIFDLEARFTIKDSTDLIILLELLAHCNVSLKVRKPNSTFQFLSHPRTQVCQDLQLIFCIAFSHSPTRGNFLTWPLLFPGKPRGRENMVCFLAVIMIITFIVVGELVSHHSRCH